jgi:hypothetical protein
MRTQRVAAYACAIWALAFMTGCAIVTPPYQPSIANVTTLKQAGSAGAAVGAFTVQAGIQGANSLGIRGSSMSSSVGGHYGDYLAEALKRELDLAQRLDPKSKVEISGVLLKNVLSAGGISRNDGEIEARIVVRRDGQVRYDKTQRATAEWESSFAGAVAIPKAQQQYPVVVQNLLAALYADTDFLAAIR